MQNAELNRKSEIENPKFRTSVFIFWSFVPRWWSWLIVRITGRQLPDKSDAWSHMGIGCISNGQAVYFEALVEKGFVGPKPIRNLIDKITETKGRLAIRKIPALDFYANGIFSQAESWVGKKGYSARQLIQMWIYERIGRWLGIPVPKSPSRLVCSEAVARLLFPPMDLRDDEHEHFDEVNPNSAYRKFLKWKWNQRERNNHVD